VTRIRDGLKLSIGDRQVALVSAGQSLGWRPGQGGLQVLRVEAFYTGRVSGSNELAASFRDENFAGRLGWKEVVVQQRQGARLLASSVPTQSVSQELRSYPQGMLISPLDVTAADFHFIPGPAVAGTTGGFTATGHLAPVPDQLSGLVGPANRSPLLLLGSLLTAALLGALHALSPGHGKAVMAAYLLGTGASRRQAGALALTITVTHTAGVLALGLVTLYASTLITPERLYPWLTLISGVLIAAVGIGLLRGRLRGRTDRARNHAHPHHRAIRGRGLLALGASGGLIPCPAALVVLLAALSMHQLVFGLLLIFTFSLGVGFVLTGIGLALAAGAAGMRRIRTTPLQALATRGARFAPALSALVVTVAGLALTAQAIPGVR
jgi:ABC-type nickel/cobalt efflux system permease component RcnA